MQASKPDQISLNSHSKSLQGGPFILKQVPAGQRNHILDFTDNSYCISTKCNERLPNTPLTELQRNSFHCTHSEDNEIPFYLEIGI